MGQGHVRCNVHDRLSFFGHADAHRPPMGHGAWGMGHEEGHGEQEQGNMFTRVRDRKQRDRAPLFPRSPIGLLANRHSRSQPPDR